MLHDLGADHQVEGRAAESIQHVPAGPDHLEPDVRVRAAGNRDAGLAQIDADDQVAARGQKPCQVAVAAADIQDARAGRQRPDHAEQGWNAIGGAAAGSGGRVHELRRAIPDHASDRIASVPLANSSRSSPACSATSASATTRCG